MKQLLCVLAVAVLAMNAGAEPLVKATGFGLPDAWVRKPFCGKLRGGEVEKCGQRWLVWMFNNKGVTNYLDEEPTEYFSEVIQCLDEMRFNIVLSLIKSHRQGT